MCMFGYHVGSRFLLRIWFTDAVMLSSGQTLKNKENISTGRKEMDVVGVCCFFLAVNVFYIINRWLARSPRDDLKVRSPDSKGWNNFCQARWHIEGASCHSHCLSKAEIISVLTEQSRIRVPLHLLLFPGSRFFFLAPLKSVWIKKQTNNLI